MCLRSYVLSSYSSGSGGNGNEGRGPSTRVFSTPSRSGPLLARYGVVVVDDGGAAVVGAELLLARLRDRRRAAGVLTAYVHPTTGLVGIDVNQGRRGKQWAS